MHDAHDAHDAHDSSMRSQPATPTEAPHIYAVGDLFVPGKSHWDDGAHFTMSGGQPIITLAWSDLYWCEVAAVDHGPLQFALRTEDPLLLFVKLGAASGWQEAPFTVWRLPDEERQAVVGALTAKVAPTSSAEDQADDHAGVTDGSLAAPHALCLIFLVQAETGRLAAMRACTISAEMTTALYEAILAQCAYSFDAAQYEADLAMLRGRYPLPDDLVADTAVVRYRCEAGA